MPDPDLSDVPDGPPIWPSDRNVNSSDRTLNEIKRLLYWNNAANEKKRDQKAFTSFHEASVSSGGGTTNLHIKNPSGTGTSIVIEDMSVTSQFRGTYSIFDQFSSAPSGGSTAGIDNILMDSAGGAPDTGIAETNSDVSFTSSGTHFKEAIPSGGSSGNPQGGETNATKPVIEPDREIVIQLVNDSANTRPGSIAVTWVEENHVYSTE